MKTPLGIRRTGALALSVTALTLAPIATPVVVPVAEASTGRMHPCTTSEIQNGKVMRRITLTSKEFKLTHAHLRRVPRGVRFSRKVTMTTITVLSASVKAAASIKAEENAWFEKASVEASVEVAGSGSHTSKTSVSEKFTVPKAPRDRELAFFDGNEYFGFKLHKRTCHPDGQKDYHGHLHSFSSVDESGAVLCPHSRYKKGSQKYQIALHSGC